MVNGENVYIQGGIIMSMISQVAGSQVSETYEPVKKGKITGKTVGNPKLTEKAQKYYEELKKKYSNMDFVLVSEDMKEQAKSQVGGFSNPHRMVVLINEEKIERMAEDENYRSQYESIIERAASQMPKLQESIGSASTNIKSYGVQIKDNGTAQYFAVIDKALIAQKENIEKKAEEKLEAKKEAKRLEKEEVIVTASSVEELATKIQDLVYAWMSDHVKTDAEKNIGSNVDYSG